MSPLRPMLACLTLAAAPAYAADAPVTFDFVTSKWIVQANGTAVVEAEVSLRLPEDKNLRIAQVPLTWSKSTETMEVLGARVEKKNGKIIHAGKEAIREDPPKGDQYFHQYSDQRRIIITFIDAEAGDLLVIKTKRDLFRPRVPGGFMTAPVLARSVGWEETNYTISVPTAAPFQIETRGFDHQSEVVLDRTVHYLRASKAQAASREVTVLGAFDRLPRFAVSTFKDWDQFALGLGGLLRPHAAVTPAVRARADALTKGIREPKDQARAIYNWVRDNVRRVPIPLEESKPEPNDAERVLANLYGDDKDHVVLLMALLSAKGIGAEPVLLNATDTATIAGPPNLRPMNHLIVYLPGLDLYADSTLASAPFGTLPFQEAGKPAIHLGGSGKAKRTIPIPAAADTVADMRTDAALSADGDLTGTTVTMATGAFGAWLRGSAGSIGQSNRVAAAVTLLRRRGTPGTGDFSFDPPASPDPVYRVTGTFKLDNQAALLRGGYFALWTGLRILPRPGDFLAGPLLLKELPVSEPTFCFPGTQREMLNLTLPDGRAIGSLPKDMAIDHDLVRYRSHWSVSGQTVTAVREFVSGIPGPLCEGPVREQMAGIMERIRIDLRNQVGIVLETNPETVPAAGPDDATKEDSVKGDIEKH